MTEAEFHDALRQLRTFWASMAGLPRGRHAHPVRPARVQDHLMLTELCSGLLLVAILFGGLKLSEWFPR